jgi:hypothetical protein
VGPSPRTFDANTVIITIGVILFKLTHAEGISNMWLHCPLIHSDAGIITESHLLTAVESEIEYVIVYLEAEPSIPSLMKSCSWIKMNYSQTDS